MLVRGGCILKAGVMQLHDPTPLNRAPSAAQIPEFLTLEVPRGKTDRNCSWKWS